MRNADCILQEDALSKAVKNFQNDEVVAVGGRLLVKREDSSQLEAIQFCEYMKTFQLSRRIFARLNAQCLISGAFGVFRKSTLVGAKSLGAYGGYETFINKLTEYHQSNPDIKYHVAVKANGQGASVPDGVEVVNGRYTYHNADCFQIKIPEKLGPAQAIYYDCAALKKSIEIIKDEGIEHPIVYIMTCRIGPFFNYFCRAIHKLGGRVFLNPDGECEIIWATREKPDFMRVYAA